jgi:hypothetical protein
VSASVVNAIHMIFNEFPSSKLKIYDRSSLLPGFMDGVVSSGVIDPVLEQLGLSMKKESRWLVIEYNGGR